jgi:hypothetical protein
MERSSKTTKKKAAKKAAPRRQAARTAPPARPAEAPAARKTPQISTYVIRDVDPEVYRRFKARAAAEGRELKFIFDRFIREYADGTPDK